MEVIFGIFTLSLLFSLFIESTSIIMGEIVMAALCRMIIFGMLFAVYNFQSQLNTAAIEIGKKRIVRKYNAIIFGVCLLTILFHMSYMRFYLNLYSIVITCISIFIAVEEYFQVVWLWRIQLTRRTSIIIDPTSDAAIVRETMYYTVFSFFLFGD